MNPNPKYMENYKTLYSLDQSEWPKCNPNSRNLFLKRLHIPEIHGESFGLWWFPLSWLQGIHEIHGKPFRLGMIQWIPEVHWKSLGFGIDGIQEIHRKSFSTTGFCHSTSSGVPTFWIWGIQGVQIVHWEPLDRSLEKMVEFGKNSNFGTKKCGNFRIFLSLRFYMKSILGIQQVQNLPKDIERP